LRDCASTRLWRCPTLRLSLLFPKTWCLCRRQLKKAAEDRSKALEILHAQVNGDKLNSRWATRE